MEPSLCVTLPGEGSEKKREKNRKAAEEVLRERPETLPQRTPEGEGRVPSSFFESLTHELL